MPGKFAMIAAFRSSFQHLSWLCHGIANSDLMSSGVYWFVNYISFSLAMLVLILKDLQILASVI